MTDDQKTYLTLDRAWSLIPGTLHAAAIHVNVREPDVELDITLRHAKLAFRFRPLFHQRVEIPYLRVGETTVAIRKKTPPVEKAEPIESPAEKNQRIAAEELLKLRNRWTIEALHIELPDLSEIEFGKKRLRGRMSIAGGFMLQPGTQCEIFPSRFNVDEGTWDNEVSNIHLNVLAQFHHFWKPWLSGSEVFRYLDAHLDGTAKVNGLEFLNVTLRSLGGYGFGSGNANLKTAIDIRGGKILGGSHLHADRSTLRLRGPRFNIDGRGELDWRAEKKGDFSRLHVGLAHAKTEIHLGSNRITGSARKISADAKLFGLDLLSAFSGLSAHLRVQGGKVTSVPTTRDSADAFRYRATGHFDGEIGVVAGEYPDGITLPKPSGFVLHIDGSKVKIPGFGTVTGNGTVSLSLKTVDFRAGRADLPRVKIAYRGEIDAKYPFTLDWTARNASRFFNLNSNDGDLWRGNGILRVGEFQGILDYLRAKKEISALERAGLTATKVHMGLAWDISPGNLHLDIRDLDSNGIWSGSGTVVSEKANDGAPAKTTGGFNGKVLGFPVHLKIGENEKKTRRP
jgi:hypothetical protein